MKELSLDDVKRIELEILDCIDTMCRAHNIKYFLEGGTLLGAARHRGFIPWDDDIDIAMTREDYDRFCALVETELPEGYYAETPLNGKNEYYGFIKIRKKGTHMPEVGMDGSSYGDGIWVDIFPYDKVDLSSQTYEQFYDKWVKYRKVVVVRANPFPTPGASALKKAVYKLCHQLLKVKPSRSYYQKLDDFACDDSAQIYIYTGLYYSAGEKLCLNEEDIFPLGTLEFEGRTYPVIHNWEKYLCQVYGNWQELPPVEQRRVHSVKATADE